MKKGKRIRRSEDDTIQFSQDVLERALRHLKASQKRTKKRLNSEGDEESNNEETHNVNVLNDVHDASCKDPALEKDLRMDREFQVDEDEEREDINTHQLMDIFNHLKNPLMKHNWNELAILLNIFLPNTLAIFEQVIFRYCLILLLNSPKKDHMRLMKFINMFGDKLTNKGVPNPNENIFIINRYYSNHELENEVGFDDILEACLEETG